jgi:hypothetical protein
MGLVKLLDPDTDPDPLITHGDMGEIWRPNWVIDEETGLPVWSGTWEIRRNSSRNFMTSIENAFNNRIKAVAEVWHNILTEDEREAWKTANATKDGARPGMQQAEANGWNLFAMVALAPVAWDLTEFYTVAPDATTKPDAITFDLADADAQELTFTIEFHNPAWSDAHIFAFVHQVDPEYIDTRSLTRRTFCTGYYQCKEAPTGNQTFTTPIAFPFNAGDKVQVLFRLHRSLDGVDNHVLSCTAT